MNKKIVFKNLVYQVQEFECNIEAQINEKYERVIMKSCDQCFVFLFLPQFDFNSENVGVVNCIDFIIK